MVKQKEQNGALIHQLNDSICVGWLPLKKSVGILRLPRFFDCPSYQLELWTSRGSRSWTKAEESMTAKKSIFPQKKYTEDARFSTRCFMWFARVHSQGTERTDKLGQTNSDRQTRSPPPPLSLPSNEVRKNIFQRDVIVTCFRFHIKHWPFLHEVTSVVWLGVLTKVNDDLNKLLVIRFSRHFQSSRANFRFL